MKKIVTLSLLALLAAGNAYADATAAVDFDKAKTMGNEILGGTDTAGTADAKTIGKLSTGVALGYNVDPLGYALITQHQLAPRAFGTAHDSTAIYVRTVTKGTGYKLPPSPSVNNTFITGAVDEDGNPTGNMTALDEWKSL